MMVIDGLVERMLMEEKEGQRTDSSTTLHSGIVQVCIAPRAATYAQQSDGWEED